MSSPKPKSTEARPSRENVRSEPAVWEIPRDGEELVVLRVSVAEAPAGGDELAVRLHGDVVGRAAALLEHRANDAVRAEAAVDAAVRGEADEREADRPRAVRLAGDDDLPVPLDGDRVRELERAQVERRPASPRERGVEAAVG
jgi:hypothetical protein